MAQVDFIRVGKTYPGRFQAVTQLNLSIEDGELMVLVGPSGCGKTTALRMVAGLEDVSDGEIRIDGALANHLEPRKRDVAMVFQNYALYPHMTVYDNIAFPLQSRRLPKSEIRERVERAAALLGLDGDILRRRPRTLSGGQRQRVAMGRAIVRQARVFLMDEPLSNLDAKLRAQMRAEISNLQRELGVTCIYVTHDQVEAMTMGSRIAVMRKGELQQVGSPQEVYDWPTNLFVATFVGSPAMNLLRGHLEQRRNGLTVVVGGQRIDLPHLVIEAHAALPSREGAEVVIGIRPEDISHPSNGAQDWPTLGGKALLSETLGSECLVHVEIAGEPIVTDQLLEVAADSDALTAEMLRQEARTHRSQVVARFGKESVPERESTVVLALNPRRLSFFDLESGDAL